MTVKLTGNFLATARCLIYLDGNAITWTFDPNTNELTAAYTGAGSAGSHNPTATIGLTAVNGTATTWMTSDSAPALSQAIVPTWTGLHTFSGGLTVSAGTTTISGHTLTLSANASIGGTNTGDQVIPAAANPSAATVGLTAANGVATTFLRSDATHALDVTIVPTWSGTHTFSKNVVINGTTTALAVNGTASAFTGFFTASSSAGNSLGVLIRGGTTAGDEALLVQNQGGSVSFFEIFGDGHGFLGPSSALGLSWSANGNLTIANPAAGNALTVTGSAAGTATVVLNTQATTGAKTAAMTATNKPGTNNQTTPAVWVPIVCDGTTYYLPAYAA